MTAARRDYGFCKGVCSLASAFDCHIRYRVYSSEISFWKDKWLEQTVLANSFQMLFSLAANKDAAVRDCYDLTHDNVVWSPQFRGEMEDWLVDG